MISATPNPVHVGEHIVICYTFNSDQGGPVELKTTFDTAGEPIEAFHNVNGKERCITIEVPAGACGLLIKDNTCGAEDLAVTVLP